MPNSNVAIANRNSSTVSNTLIYQQQLTTAVISSISVSIATQRTDSTANSAAAFCWASTNTGIPPGVAFNSCLPPPRSSADNIIRQDVSQPSNANVSQPVNANMFDNLTNGLNGCYWPSFTQPPSVGQWENLPFWPQMPYQPQRKLKPPWVHRANVELDLACLEGVMTASGMTTNEQRAVMRIASLVSKIRWSMRSLIKDPPRRRHANRRHSTDQQGDPVTPRAHSENQHGNQTTKSTFKLVPHTLPAPEDTLDFLDTCLENLGGLCGDPSDEP